MGFNQKLKDPLRIRGEIIASIDTPGDGGWRSLQGINLEYLFHLFRIGSLDD